MTDAWVYVLWGQSNAAGAGTDGVPARYATIDPGVLIWNIDTGAIEPYEAGVNSNTINGGNPLNWGSEAEFSLRHRREFPGRPIYILKFARASSLATNWLPPAGNFYTGLTDELDLLKAELVSQGFTPIVKAVIGMQGENDSTNAVNAAAYGTNKSTFYAAARADWGDSNTKFVDGRISNSPVNTYGSLVRNGQLLAAAAEQDAVLVDTDSLPRNSDDLHYNNLGEQTLGMWFYQAYRTASPPTTVFLSLSLEAAVPSSNRTQLVSVVESTLGTTPTTPRMRTRRFTGEGLRYAPTFEEPNELRSDRMTGDETQTGTETGGTINWELHYPYPSGPLDVDFESALYNPWTESVSRDNDGTADSVITNVATAGEIVTVTTGTAFPVNALVRFTGFGVTLNNGVFVCTAGSATVPAFVGSGITDEAVPPAAARMKVVGMRGGSGDISATATGLASGGVSFATRGFIPGQWIKIGGTQTATKFATAALNAWVRITAVTASALTLDHLPAGWTTDAGTSKTIYIWYGDTIINGTTQTGQSFEKGFLSQTVPVYLLYKGMVTVQMQLNFDAKRKITGQSTYLGMSGAESTTTQDASPDAPLALASYPVFASSANVGQVSEAGSALASPNFVRSLQININNNATPIDAVDSLGPAGVTGHECQITGTMSTYFGSDTLLAKFFAGTPTSLAIRATKGTQAIIVGVPRAVYNGGGSPQAGGKNQDVMLDLNWRASKDETTTNAMIVVDRLEYFE